MHERGLHLQKHKKAFREQTQAGNDGYLEYRQPLNGTTFTKRKGVVVDSQ